VYVGERVEAYVFHDAGDVAGDCVGAALGGPFGFLGLEEGEDFVVGEDGGLFFVDLHGGWWGGGVLWNEGIAALMNVPGMQLLMRNGRCDLETDGWRKAANKSRVKLSEPVANDTSDSS